MNIKQSEADRVPPLAGSTDAALVTLLSNLPGIAYACSPYPPWTMFYLSPGVEAITGYPSAFLTTGGLTWADIIHPDDLPTLTHIVDNAIRDRRPFTARYRVKCAAGEEKCVLERGEAIFGPDGVPTSIVGFISDITQQEHMQVRLKESGDDYGLVMEINERFSWVADATGAAIELSSKFLANIGMAHDQALGDGWLQVLHPEDLVSTSEYWADAVASGTPIDLRFRIRHANGDYRWYHTRGRPQKAPSGHILQWQGTSEEIDGRVRAEIRLAQAQANLIHMSQDQAMSVMAVTLAHELNQPLAAASNYLTVSCRLAERLTGIPSHELLTALDQSAEQIRRASEIIRRARALVQMDPPRRDIVSLNDLTERVVSLLRAGGLCSSLRVTKSISRGAKKVVVDQIQIEQVLLNLIRNSCTAMSTTNSPAIIVSATKEPPNWVKITVRDFGTGLSKAAQQHLFAAYALSETGGMGAGLAISRTIVEAHGGRLWAENHSEGGASFMFTVPSAPDRQRRDSLPLT